MLKMFAAQIALCIRPKWDRMTLSRRRQTHFASCNHHFIRTVIMYSVLKYWTCIFCTTNIIKMSYELVLYAFINFKYAIDVSQKMFFPLGPAATSYFVFCIFSVFSSVSLDNTGTNLWAFFFQPFTMSLAVKSLGNIFGTSCIDF